MYKCDKCNETSLPGQKQINKVIETRPIDYFDEYKKYVANGREIVKEIKICPRCDIG